MSDLPTTQRELRYNEENPSYCTGVSRVATSPSMRRRSPATLHSHNLRYPHRPPGIHQTYSSRPRTHTPPTQYVYSLDRAAMALNNYVAHPRRRVTCRVDNKRRRLTTNGRVSCHVGSLILQYYLHTRAVKRFFNREIIAVLMHVLLLHFQFVCVAFAGRRRWPIAVES